jgi:multicomponent Na+:H+ antiporter subunit E
MNIKTKSRIIVFILSMLCWFALTDIKNVQEVLIGIVVSLLVSLIAGHMLVTTSKSRNIFKRIFGFILYAVKFIWELIKANIHVAYIVLHPKMPIKPGIVKIKTKLTKDSALTIIANSITLTPGTLTMDVNKNKGDLYIHWIDTKTTDIDEATELIGGRFEKSLTEVFE